jgi:hypothetical protein
MLLTPKRETTDSPEPRSSIAEPFGLSPEEGRTPQDASTAANPRSGRLDAALSWFWRFLVDGFAAYGVAMAPCFEDPSDLLDSLYPQRHERVEKHATMAPAERSPWHFDDLTREAMTVRLVDTALAGIELGTHEHSNTGKSGAP